MNRNTKVPLGKKDAVLREWWDSVSNNETISQPICVAIAYYAKTGKFLEIGTYKGSNQEYENTVKYLYIPEGSPAYNYLQERQDSGERVATVVKFILRNSIRKDVQSKAYGLDELRIQLESLNHSVEKVYVTEETLAEKAKETQPPLQKEEIHNTYQEPQPVDTSLDDSEGDLINALLGDISFSI